MLMAARCHQMPSFPTETKDESAAAGTNSLIDQSEVIADVSTTRPFAFNQGSSKRL